MHQKLSVKMTLSVLFRTSSVRNMDIWLCFQTLFYVRDIQDTRTPENKMVAVLLHFKIKENSFTLIDFISQSREQLQLVFFNRRASCVNNITFLTFWKQQGQQLSCFLLCLSRKRGIKYYRIYFLTSSGASCAAQIRKKCQMFKSIFELYLYT